MAGGGGRGVEPIHPTVRHRNHFPRGRPLHGVQKSARGTTTADTHSPGRSRVVLVSDVAGVILLGTVIRRTLGADHDGCGEGGKQHETQHEAQREDHRAMPRGANRKKERQKGAVRVAVLLRALSG